MAEKSVKKDSIKRDLDNLVLTNEDDAKKILGRELTTHEKNVVNSDPKVLASWLVEEFASADGWLHREYPAIAKRNRETREELSDPSEYFATAVGRFLVVEITDAMRDFEKDYYWTSNEHKSKRVVHKVREELEGKWLDFTNAGRAISYFKDYSEDLEKRILEAGLTDHIKVTVLHTLVESFEYFCADAETLKNQFVELNK